MLTRMEKTKKNNCENENLKAYQLYGQIIRAERKKRNLTLENTARGICSISYLCKLENNLIIPDEFYLKAIFERIQVDYELVEKTVIENYGKILVRAYLTDSIDTITMLYNNIEEVIFNPYNSFIKAMYYLVMKQYNEFSQVIKILDEIKDTFAKSDLGLLVFLVIQYYIDTFQYSEAYRHLKLYSISDTSIEELDWLVQEQHIFIGYNLKKYQMVYKAGNYLKKYTSLGYPVKRHVIIHLIMMDIETQDYGKEVTDKLSEYDISTTEYANDSTVIYWLLLAKCHLQKYLEIYDYVMDNNLFHNPDILALFVYVADQIKDSSYVKKAVAIAEKYEFKKTDIIHQKFIKFIAIKHSDCKKHIVADYLKQNILPFKSTYNHHLYTEYYRNFYVNYLCEISKYKDAVMILSQANLNIN